MTTTTITTTTNDMARVLNAFEAFVAVARQAYGTRLAEALEACRSGHLGDSQQVLAEIDALQTIIGNRVAELAPATVSRVSAADVGGDLVSYILDRVELHEWLDDNDTEVDFYPAYRAELDRLIGVVTC